MVNKDKLIVALDVPSLREAERLVKKLSPLVRTFKVGQELFTSVGPEAVQMVHSHKARVFLDLKFHDIPNTVGAACAAATQLGVFMLNVHALGGSSMMKRAVDEVHETAHRKKVRPPILLAVTVLTSLLDRDLREVGISNKTDEEVRRLAILSEKCGMDGVVASGQEISIIRKAAPRHFLIVTPGVRPAWAASQDQKRVVTPREAIEKGANFIVVGRAVTGSPDPKAAAEKILKEIA